MSAHEPTVGVVGLRYGRAPSLVDGLRAQVVLDAVLESSRRRAWVSVDE